MLNKFTHSPIYSSIHPFIHTSIQYFLSQSSARKWGCYDRPRGKELGPRGPFDALQITLRWQLLTALVQASPGQRLEGWSMSKDRAHKSLVPDTSNNSESIWKCYLQLQGSRTHPARKSFDILTPYLLPHHWLEAIGRSQDWWSRNWRESP